MTEKIARAFEKACLAELQALKPGNVHVHAEGHGMSVADFERSAAVAAPWIAGSGMRVGQRILGAVRATKDAVGLNTNLGIVLLCAPLAAAAGRGPDVPLRAALAEVLDDLDVPDAADAFEAIRIAAPAGMGTRSDHDVREVPTITLLEAMRLAALHDRIAKAYTDAFEDVFTLGLNTLEQAEAELGRGPWAAAAVHLAFLRSFPDSHVVRKHGEEVALDLMRKARSFRAHPENRTELLAFDAVLKETGLNPGTTADLTVATLFAEKIRRMEA